MVVVELDVREQLVRASRVGAVLGHLDDRERLACVLGRAHRCRPARRAAATESSRDARGRIGSRSSSTTSRVWASERLGALEVGGVDERVSEQDAEPRRLNPVAAPLRVGEALVEHLDRAVQVAEHRVRAPERVGELRMVDDVRAVRLERLLEVGRRPSEDCPAGSASWPRPSSARPCDRGFAASSSAAFRKLLRPRDRRSAGRNRPARGGPPGRRTRPGPSRGTRR